MMMKAPFDLSEIVYPIVETDCTITGPDGQSFTAHGAIFDLDQGGCLYVGEPTGRNYLGYPGMYVPYGPLTDWHGNRVGTYWAISHYRNNLGAVITCIRARIEGREYHGRYGSDWSQLVNLKPVKSNA